MTPEETELAERFSTAIFNIAIERFEAGDRCAVIVQAVGLALGKLLAQFSEPEESAAWLRMEARKIESMAPKAKGSASVPELVQIQHRAQEFINTLQVAGIAENEAVTAMHNACVERVVRASGAAGAAQWLRNLAKLTEQNGPALEAIARAS